MHNMNSHGRKRRMPAAKSPEPDRQTKGRFSTKVSGTSSDFIFSRATVSYISFHWTRNKPYHFPPRWTTMSTARSPPSPAIPATPSMTPSLPLRWLHPHYFQPEFPALQTALTQLGGSQDELHLNIGKLEIPGISQNSNRMSSQESPGI